MGIFKILQQSISHSQFTIRYQNDLVNIYILVLHHPDAETLSPWAGKTQLTKKGQETAKPYPAPPEGTLFAY
jgi:hypothetical protein